MSATEKNQPTCLPPEAYIHLWNAAATDKKLRVQKIKYTVYPTKK
jgi:hypothetical protein